VRYFYNFFSKIPTFTINKWYNKIRKMEIAFMCQKEGQIRFPIKIDKLIQAVLWLLYHNNETMDKIKLIKLFFLADRAHLAKYGRPIAGGNYYNMDHGPVLSQLKDILDYQYDNQAGPFTLTKEHLIIAKEKPDDSTLSESDLKILDFIYRKYGHHPGWKLVDYTHKLQAYQDYEPSRGGRKDLPYEAFFLDLDQASQQMLDLIRDHQESAGIIG